MRTALILFHRWLALVTSAFIILLGLTGAALVFEGALDRALNPALWYVTAGARPLSLDSVAARAAAFLPDGAVNGLSFPRTRDRAIVAQMGTHQVFVDPYTGHVLGTRDRADFDRTLPRVLHRLHTQLMLGRIGSEVIGIATLASLILVLTGAYLWWAEKLWRIRWSASWKRVAYDLHHSLGIAASVVLLIITASGSVIHYNTLGNIIASVGARPREATAKRTSAARGSSPVSLDSTAQLAAAAVPGASLSMMSLSGTPGQPTVVTLRYPEDRTPGGRTRVYVDRGEGRVLSLESTRAATAGMRVSNEMRSIHTGDVFGPTTEMLWLVAAIVLAGQGLTGVLMWWNGRFARAAASRKRRGHPASTEHAKPA